MVVYIRESEPTLTERMMHRYGCAWGLVFDDVSSPIYHSWRCWVCGNQKALTPDTYPAAIRALREMAEHDKLHRSYLIGRANRLERL